MDDKTARAWASKHFGATVLPFEQDPATCAALCALWIRKQLKGGSIFGSEKRLWRPPEATPRTFFKVTDPFDDKIDVMKLSIKGDGFSAAFEKNYITQGSRSPAYNKGLKPIKETRHVAKEVEGTGGPHAITEKGTGILTVFDRTMTEVSVSSIGYRMKDKNGREFSHAVALDCTKPTSPFIFFDPLIGQFSFPSRETFRKWWRACWTARREPGADDNAWSDIDETKTVWATHYRN